MVYAAPAWAAGKTKQPPTEIKVPDLLLDGGRTVKFERVFSNDREVKLKKGFWTKAFDFVVGEPDFHFLVRPYSIVTDSRGRIIVSDPGAIGVHIFDFEQQKYKFLSRKDKGKDPMLAPQCVAVDDKDNIYVTDSEAGKIFVYEPSGKYQRAIGSLKGGEGYFKRPTGIAVDSSAQRIYVTDTLRNQVFMLDMQGSVLGKFGKTGAGQRGVQLSHGIAPRWAEPDRGGRHELPRPGAGSLRRLPVFHRPDRRRPGRLVPSQGNRHRLGRPPLRRRWQSRPGAGV